MASSAATQTMSDIREVFKYKLRKDWTRKAVCDREYILVHRLKAWMNNVEEGGTQNNAGRLLHAVYSNHPKHQFQPVDSQSISTCLLVFAILLLHGFGDRVHHFRRANIADNILGTSSLSYRTLRHMLRDDAEQANKVLTLFDRDRWKFCPVEIRSDMEKTYLYDRQIVPFCKKQAINEKGGTAQVFQVLLQEDFVSSELQDRMSYSKVEDKEFGTCYQLALKSYLAEDFFDWETDAFTALKGQEGMVQCICSYSLAADGEDTSSKSSTLTHNILLEYGELDLDEFFVESDPPVHPLEIIGFWEKFFRVAKALHSLHYLPFQNRDGSQESLHGWHADLKPDNILQVHGEFKLADFGFAKFKKAHQDAPKEYIEGGTQSYGSPELDKARRARGTRTPVSQTIDTWSFGCVLSVAVTWVVLGYTGIVQFEKLRRTSIRSLRARRALGEKLLSTPAADDAFHDGTVVLPEVLEWFDYLRHGLRRSDFVCGRILDLVREAMLLKDPDSRRKSPALCDRLDEILDLAQRDLEKQLHNGIVRQITPTIFGILQDDDEAASEVNSAVMRTTQPDTIDARRYRGNLQPTIGARDSRASRRFGKSERLEKRTVLKTGHRAMQHSQAFPRISKRSTGTSSASNPGIPEEAAISESPTKMGKPAQADSITDDISPLFPKSKVTAESNGHVPLVTPKTQQDHPTVIVSTPEKEDNTNGIEPTSPIRFASKMMEAAVSNEVAALPPDPGSPPSVSSPTIQWPLLDPHGYDNCGTLQDKYPDLEIFQTRKELDLQGAGRSRSFTAKLRKPKQDAYLKSFIEGRDIIFVFDSAASMTQHWAVATYTAETLAMKVANLDDDGIDYVFTTGGQKNKVQSIRKNEGQTIRRAMNQASPEEVFQRTAMRPVTNMGDTLDAIFNHYMKGPKNKKMTLLVFTDGVWGGTPEKAVEVKIQGFASNFKQKSKQGPFSIEFISFGNDQTGIPRLQYLDDELGKDYQIHDVIDTEPWSGRVYKMILGSFEEEQFQNDEDDFPGGYASSSTQGLPLRPVSRTGTNKTEPKTPKRHSTGLSFFSLNKR